MNSIDLSIVEKAQLRAPTRNSGYKKTDTSKSTAFAI